MTTYTKQDLEQIASSIMDTMFKCQDRIEGTKNKLTIESNLLKIEQLNKLLHKVEIHLGVRAE